MKVGDLVQYTLNQPGDPRRLGIIVKSGSYKRDHRDKRVHTVQFFDGLSPESNSFRESVLEVISESR